MHRVTLTLIFITTLSSCYNKNDEVKELAIEHIEEESLRTSTYIHTNYQAKGQRTLDKTIYDRVLAIRRSKDSIYNILDKPKTNQESFYILNGFNKLLDSISSSSDFDNSSYGKLITNNLNSFRKNSKEYSLLLALYEKDLLYHYASYISPIGLTFTSSVQFSKPNYDINELIVFTITAFDIDYYRGFKYDSLSFSVNGQKETIDYTLERVVNTAIVKFHPVSAGRYNIKLYTSYSTDIDKAVTEVIETYIDVNN